MTIHDQDLDESEIARCPSESSTAIAPAPDVATDQALVKQSDSTMGVVTTFDEAVNLDRRRLPGKLTSVALILPEDLPHEQWLQTIETLKGIEQSRAWWWGDLLNFGEHKYGKMYEQALDASDLSYNTLRNAKMVAKRFELSRRRDNLGWGHHREVAAIRDEAEQDQLLDEAEENGLSQKVLRTLIRDRYPKSGTSTVVKKLPNGRHLTAGDASDQGDDDGPAVHDQSVNGEIAGGETADAVDDNGNNGAGLDALAGAAPAQSSTPPSDDVTEVSESPSPEEHDNAAQGAAQVRPDASQRVVTSADLRIYPDVDPYGERDPQWVRGALQAIGPIADAVSTLSPLPGRDRIIGLLLQLFDVLAPVLLEIPIPEEKRGKIVSLLRTYLGYKDLAHQLLAGWEAIDAAIAGRQAQLFTDPA
jgi:hypothetical protein